MFQFEKYDFSKETKIKDKLFDKMKAIYEKAKSETTVLSDDDLELVFAATGVEEERKCPLFKEKCENCEYYIKSDFGKGVCRINCK